MFFPISWTSPFTVAINTLPEEDRTPFFSASINGNKYATAFFITRADFTTCGKNIFPLPKRSPTVFIPAINGPSITSIGRSNWCLHSSVSSSMNSTIPFTKECASLSFTGTFLQERSISRFLPSPFTVSASSNKRSVASSRRFNNTSSTCSKSSLSISE